jgi:ribosomal protein S18 acetylase RimI-like enzyme
MITIRPDRPEDQPDIQAVEAAATATLRQTYRPNQRALANKARLGRQLRRIVAIVEGHVIGTVQYYMENRSVRVIGLGVHPDFRRRGVARALLGFLEEIGKKEGATHLHLYTVKQTGNVEVFEHLGFTVIAEREDEYSESNRYQKLIDVEMEKRLK